MNKNKKLRNSLENTEFFKLPGIYDTMGAKIVQNLGFDAVYLSGGSYSAMNLGYPDIGFYNMSEAKNILEKITNSVDIPVIADADGGFGNAIHAAQTAKMFSRLGVSGMQIDDTVVPQSKPFKDKEAISWDLIAPKLQAARQNVNDDFVIIYRTVIGKTKGLEEALIRANKSKDLGVDYVFIEGINSIKDLEFVAENSKVKLMINLNEKGFSYNVDINTIMNLGFKIGLYPVSTMRAAKSAMNYTLGLIKNEGSTIKMKDYLLSSPVTPNSSVSYYADEYSKYYVDKI